MVLFGISHSYISCAQCTAQQGPWIKARRQSILILLSQRSHRLSPDSGQAEHRGRPSRGRPCLERWRRGLCGGRRGNRGSSNSWAALPAMGRNSEGDTRFQNWMSSIGRQIFTLPVIVKYASVLSHPSVQELISKCHACCEGSIQVGKNMGHKQKIHKS